MDENAFFCEYRPPLFVRGSRALLPQISTLQGKSSAAVLTAGLPSLPRKQEEIPTHPPLPKPEPSAAQRALIELRSLHGHKHALTLLQLQRSLSKAGVRASTRDGTKPPSRSRKPFRQGLLKDSRSVNESDTVKHLMHQLSELNNITYKREIKGGSESFCSEIALQARQEGISAVTGEVLRPQTTKDFPVSEISSGNQRSHNVMKLIERQILRDLTRHIQRSNKERGINQHHAAPDTKTHSDELPGEMKVVIKKTAKKGEKAPKSGDITTSRSHDITLPVINKTAPATSRRKRIERYEWSLEEPHETKTTSSPVLPTMSRVTLKGQATLDNTEMTVPKTPSRKHKSHLHGDGMHSGLPRIQEEPDNFPQVKVEAKVMRDVGTCVSPIPVKDFSPISESPESGKVKLPILGKSIGQQREITYENGAKFIKPSIGEIKRIIHGLYGDYFDFTLDRYYTYENQFNEPKNSSELDTPLHFVTPALDDSKTPAGSHTLQLFKSAKRRVDESPTKSQKMSVPLIRSKYGKAIASINKSTERVAAAAAASKSAKDHHLSRRHENQSAIEMDYLSFLKDQAHYGLTPNTPNEKALRNHIAYQVALYHEQIARENRSLQQTNVLTARDPTESRYLAEDQETKMTLSQFAEDIDRYAQYLEAYVDAKRKQSQERKMKLKELKQRQKEKKQEYNKHLEAVENRDAFLAQVAISNYRQQNPKTPKTPANTLPAKDDVENDVTFDYTQEAPDQTPIAKVRSKEDKNTGKDLKSAKHPMGTKVYRIFGERKNSDSTIRRWVAQAPVPYSSRLIKRQVPRSSKSRSKAAVFSNPKSVRPRGATKPHVMTDLVSRFQVATRYKLDRQYVASLASGTI